MKFPSSPLVLAALLLTALTAAAETRAETGLRLQPGGGTERLQALARTGADTPARSLRLDLGLSPNFAAGPVVGWREPSAGVPDVVDEGALAVGGFVELAIADYRFAGSVTGARDGRQTAALGAAYAAAATTYRLTLGTQWGGAAGLATAFADRTGREVDLTFSVTHSITPNLYVSGMAAASRVSPEPADRAAEPAGGLLFGAGLGLRF